ncbi:MAG TPA: His/Gly/Thr/Pro-type tRNA ligase C-terminal domain-containing protein, partial [Caldisericia bacterium]|nr:His/Gly/Thr/Pro-type tRNA ligase C-terminal domain-containing protein [Caldisericia bacterium]
VKFKDADLMGFPLRITIGKKAKDGIVEVRNRKTKQSIDKPAQEVVVYVKEFLRENR